MMDMISRLELKSEIFFLNAQEVDTHTKYLFYIIIPFNLLLWGSES